MGRRGIQSQKIGKKFGHLTVIAEAGLNESGKTLYRCRCDCGKEVIRVTSTLQPNVNSSCGCELAKKHAQIIREAGARWRAQQKEERAKKKAAESKSEGVKVKVMKDETLCWTCIRSAAPPSLQCIRDKTKGERLPEGAEYTAEPISIGVKVTVTSCPEYLPMMDKNNMKLLELERKKNCIRMAKELGERALVVGSYGHGEVVKL